MVAINKDDLQARFRLDDYIQLVNVNAPNDPSYDKDYQRRLKSFWIVPRSVFPGLCKESFIQFSKVNQCQKNHEVDALSVMEEVLRELAKVGGSVEFSFVTKMLASINPDLPVWDSYVSSALKKRSLLCGDGCGGKDIEDRVKTALANYSDLLSFYKQLEQSGYLDKFVCLFDRNFLTTTAHKKISKNKKVDYLIWALGRIESVGSGAQ